MNVTFKQYFDHLCLLNFSTDLIKINAYVKTILFVKLYLPHLDLVSVSSMFDLVTANCLQANVLNNNFDQLCGDVVGKNVDQSHILIYDVSS